MSKNWCNVWIHIIWTTKNRKKVLHKRYRTALFCYIREHAIENEIHLDFINGVEDHVHVLVKLRPTQTISSVVKLLKGSSSNWINNKKILGEHVLFRWQRGYGVVSVSPDRIKIIRNYIRNQEQHHKPHSLDNELEQFEYFE